jgi:phospholipid transport system transporter-binding protein
VTEGGGDEVTIVGHGAGRFAVQGDLTYQTAVAALEQSKTLFAGHAVIDLDLAGVKRADSAGLALLLEWLNWSRRSARELRFHGIPGQLLSIAQISEVDELLVHPQDGPAA